MILYRLGVWAGQHKVGELGYEISTGIFSFMYEHTWEMRGDTYAISPALPLDADPFDGLGLGANVEFDGRVSISC